jgi:P4 family phage/plasmid primase-like protien
LGAIFIELKEKMLAMQRAENEASRSRQARIRGDDDEDDASRASYQRFIVDNREQVVNPEQLAAEQKEKIYTRMQYERCSMIIQFLDKLSNKKTVIEDLSQKCYDEDFYKKLDVNNDIYVCTNGVLDLDSCIFRDGQPSDMMTLNSGIDYPKNIDSVEAQDIMCSIQEWLDKIFPDDEVQNYVLNVFACKLSGSLGYLGERFHIFTGSGANGKSQFFKLIKEAFGDYYLAADNTLLNTPKRDPNSASPAIAILKAKRVVSLTEPKNNIPFESDKVKELVSGDPLTCRHLNKDPIQFIPQYALFLQCNDIPRNESTDDGFWRKIYIVPCESKFILKDEDMYKLSDPVKFPNHFIGTDQAHLYKDWAPYFLFLLFERYRTLKINDFKFPVPEKMKAATRQYQEEASPYTQFYNDKLEEAPGYKVDAATLYQEFQQFVGRDFKTQKPTFLKQMERMIGKPRGKNKDYYGFRIFGTSGEPIEGIDANNSDAE